MDATDAATIQRLEDKIKAMDRTICLVTVSLWAAVFYILCKIG